MIPYWSLLLPLVSFGQLCNAAMNSTSDCKPLEQTSPPISCDLMKCTCVMMVKLSELQIGQQTVRLSIVYSAGRKFLEPSSGRVEVLRRCLGQLELEILVGAEPRICSKLKICEVLASCHYLMYPFCDFVENLKWAKKKLKLATFWKARNNTSLLQP